MFCSRGFSAQEHELESHEVLETIFFVSDGEGKLYRDSTTSAQR